MKKSIVLLIGVIYIASIIFIGFFGMKITAYKVDIYVSDIEILNEDLKVSNGKNSIVFSYDPQASKEENVYFLTWRVYPENATNKSVNFVYDTQSTVASVDKAGRIWVNKPGVLTIQIVSNQKSSVSKEIIFIVR